MDSTLATLEMQQKLSHEAIERMGDLMKRDERVGRC